MAKPNSEISEFGFFFTFSGLTVLTIMRYTLPMTTTNPTINIPPRDPRERAAWVQYQLKLRGLTFTDLGRREGVSQQAVKSALYSASQYLEEAIAQAIGLSPELLFPERFDASGRRLHKSRQKHRSGAAAESNNQLDRAA